MKPVPPPEPSTVCLLNMLKYFFPTFDFSVSNLEAQEEKLAAECRKKWRNFEGYTLAPSTLRIPNGEGVSFCAFFSDSDPLNLWDKYSIRVIWYPKTKKGSK